MVYSRRENYDGRVPRVAGGEMDRKKEYAIGIWGISLEGVALATC